MLITTTVQKIRLAVLILFSIPCFAGALGSPDANCNPSVDSPSTGGCTWYNFYLYTDGTVTTGSSFTNYYVAAPAPPWTITTTAPEVIRVVDGGHQGDVFDVYDNGNFLGETSATPIDAAHSCANDPTGSGLDPAACWNDPLMSQGTFSLAPGSHSLTIVWKQQVPGGPSTLQWLEIGAPSSTSSVAVPNVVGMTEAAATTTITGDSLTVGTVTTISSPSVTAGNVISENPTSGTMASSGSPVSLVVAGSQPISIAPATGSSGRQLFSFVARDAAGASNIQSAQFLFSKAGLSALNACYIYFDPVANVFYLLSDDMTSWYGLLARSTNTIGNAQCTIYGATSGSASMGTDLTTSVDVSFRSGFAGLKTIYQFSADTLGDGSGWQQMGTWKDTGDPNVVELTSLTPNSGTGISQIFTAVTTDGNGATTIPFVELVVTAQPINSFNGNGCFVFYEQAANVFFLLNDAATQFYGLVAGSAGSVSNSQCTLTGTESGGTAVGSNLTVTYNLTFSGSFTGTKQIYMQAADDNSVIEVWHQMSTWIP